MGYFKLNGESSGSQKGIDMSSWKLYIPDFNFSSIAQSRAFRAGSVKGGCSGLKKYMSDFPSSSTVSSRTLKRVIPLALKNFAALLVPARTKKD